MAVISACRAGLFEGLTPPSTKSPLTAFRPPAARPICSVSGSKKYGAAVLARTTCHSGYSRFGMVVERVPRSKYRALGLLVIGQGLPLSSRLVITSRPVRKSGLSSRRSPSTPISAWRTLSASNLARNAPQRSRLRLKTTLPRAR